MDYGCEFLADVTNAASVSHLLHVSTVISCKWDCPYIIIMSSSSRSLPVILTYASWRSICRSEFTTNDLPCMLFMVHGCIQVHWQS